MCFPNLVCIFFYETMHITYNGWYKYFWMLNILKSPAIARHVEKCFRTYFLLLNTKTDILNEDILGPIG